MNEGYRTLAGRVRLELEELEGVGERIRQIWAQAAQAPNDFLVDAVALNLHSFYAGLERIFSSIATRLDRSIPTGETWHVELLRQIAAEVQGVRPPVISTALLDGLDRYSGFRHVVRNAYAYWLDPRQIAPLVEDLESVQTQLRAERLAFAERVERIGTAGG
ncbi:MAG: ribonuclease toxin HepT-like protein [Thermoleophilia bacterium]